MERKEIKMLFALLRSAIYGNKLSDSERDELTAEIMPDIYKIAYKHDLGHIILCALSQNGISINDEDWKKRLEKLQFQALYRYEQSEYELSEIRNIFNEGGIAYIPLKGAVIRHYYPEPWMRTSCDIDVLIHDTDIDRAVKLLTEKGWIADEQRGYHDVSLHSSTGIHLELHFNIRENNASLDNVLDRVWEYSEPVVDGGHEYRQKNEFLMFHLLAHMAYHFISGGCGIRSFIDIRILEGAIEFSKDELLELCRSAGIERFYENVSKLTDVWLLGAPYTELIEKMEQFVITGGIYGSVENKVAINQAKSGGKFKNIAERIFAPYDSLKIRYPKLEGKRWKMPFYQVLRWWQMLTGGRLQNSVNELKTANMSTDGEIKETHSFLDDVGLGI